MKVSIVVPTKNEEKNIENCLKLAAKQNFPRENFEIVVVDNDSSDQTKEIAAKYADKVFDHGPERSAQRNFGIRKAGGMYVMYIDADMRLSEDVVRECVEKAEGNSELVALFIPEKISGKSYWNKVRNFERDFYNATAIDAPRFVRKEKFFEAGGFDENLTGPEDWDLAKKIRRLGKTDIIKSFLLHNEEEFTLKKYLAKKTYYSRDFEKYVMKWGKNDPDIRKQFGLWYRYVGVFTENGKWKKLLCHPILAAGMYIERFLVGLNYVFRK